VEGIRGTGRGHIESIGSAAFPKAPGIEEGYVVTVKAKDFIEQVLIDKNDGLRQRIFEENVRDFIGSESQVNSEIADTLKDGLKQKRFGILNNGITIISPDVKVAGLDIYLRDFQIVNGCQTSNVLFERHLPARFPDRERLPDLERVVRASRRRHG
jgi:hypothetical protein